MNGETAVIHNMDTVCKSGIVCVCVCVCVCLQEYHSELKFSGQREGE